MTWKATQVVLEESKHKGSALLLLLILANHAHEDGRYAFPSVATMARYTRMGRRNVQILLRKLEQSGELQEMGIHNSGTVIYRIVLPGLERGGAKFAPPVKKGAKPRSQGGDPSITEGAITDSPEPLINHKEPSEDDHAELQERLRVLMRLVSPGGYRMIEPSLYRGDPDLSILRARVENAIAQAKKGRR